MNTPVTSSLGEIEAAGFFAVRTPLLPFGELVAWSFGLSAITQYRTDPDPSSLDKAWRADIETLRARLRDLLDRPEILNALLIASPSLLAGLDYWRQNADSKRGLQAERSLVRYFSRMCGRCTPFGLFAGLSLGTVRDIAGPAFEIALGAVSECRTATRLDFDCLFSIVSDLERHPPIAEHLTYFCNPTLHKVSDSWHYIQSVPVSGATRTHRLVSLEANPTIDAVIEQSRIGMRRSQLLLLIQTLSGSEEVSASEVVQYVQDLVDEGVLESSLVPRVTGDALDGIIEELASCPPGRAYHDALHEIRTQLRQLDAQGVATSAASYERVRESIRQLAPKADSAQLYQVDLSRPARQCVMTRDLASQLLSGIEMLYRLGPPGEPTPLRDFREKFANRYERQWVPLLEALDEEIGIGFSGATGDKSSVIRGLTRDGSDDPTRPLNGHRLTGMHPVFLEKLMRSQASGDTEIDLSLADFPKREAGWRVPDSFSVMATVVAASPEAVQQGKYELVLRSCVGPSGVRLLGRFCHTDADLERFVRSYAASERQDPQDPVLAEIIYLPQGRVGNVLSRPVLRDYELVYVGRSGAAREKQIPISDVWVGLDGQDISLYSPTLKRRIVPRLTSAHSFSTPGLPAVYRFLCLLQHQHGVAAPHFDWGDVACFQRLPRIRVGRVILVPSEWHLAPEDRRTVCAATGSRRFAAMQALRQQYGLPRWIHLVESDTALPVDLNNPLSVDACVQVMKRADQGKTILREMLPSAEQLCVSGPDGYYMHELNIPFLRRAARRPAEAARVRSVPTSAPPQDRLFAPGSDWLYLKVYGGAATLDQVLRQIVPGVIAHGRREGIIEQWFFVRYADPDYHLRLRFMGSPRRLIEELMPTISEEFRGLLGSGEVWRLQLDTYRREIERYGGIQGVSIAEELFHNDSDAVLDILQQFRGDVGEQARWKCALLSMDCWLSDLGFKGERKLPLLEAGRPAGTERTILGQRFREERGHLKAILDPTISDGTLEHARRILARRSERSRDAATRLHELWEKHQLGVEPTKLARSLVHMNFNRLMQFSPNVYERLGYEFLYRLYQSDVSQNLCHE